MGCLFFVVEVRQVVHAVVRRLLLVVIRRALHDGRILAHQLGADELVDFRGNLRVFLEEFAGILAARRTYG